MFYRRWMQLERRISFWNLRWRVLQIHSLWMEFLIKRYLFSRFGVCCVFKTSTCGSTVSQNCSYICNPGFSSAYTSTSNCQYTIHKCDSCKFHLNSRSFLLILNSKYWFLISLAVCDFRLDFDTFDTNAPSNSVETDNAHPCQDILTITTVNSIS